MMGALSLALLALISAPRSETKSACPIMLVSGAKDQDTISVTFRNIGRPPAPIRRLEFNCRLQGARQARCFYPKASFLPFGEDTVHYPIPPRSSRPASFF